MLSHDNDIINERLASYLLGEADAATAQQVEEWIAQHANNKRYYEHFKLILETSQTINVANTIDEKAAWRRFQERTGKKNSQPTLIRSFSRWKIAAAAVVGFGAAYLIWETSTPYQVVAATDTTAKTDTLPDGSFITLNKNSSVSYARGLKGNDRKIELKGEAFFQVAQNKDKPFVVEVNDIKITVLGTSFNVKTNKSETEVVVETGAVQVSRKNQSIILRAHEKLEVAAEDTALRSKSSTDVLYNYYRTQEFVCDDTPLWKLVEILNEAYQVDIVIENDKLRQLPLTTTFHNESLDQILKIISETFGIKVENSYNKIILK